MKRIKFLIVALLVCAASTAQTTSEGFKAKYDRQVRIVGADGVGVELILDKWAEAFPDDPDMLTGRFVYYLSKSQSTTAVPKKLDKYLGQKPIVSLKDSTGADVNYFQETVYVDSLFAKASSAIDRAVALFPNDLGYRVEKINALVGYEKESPDMALSEILTLIDRDQNLKPEWTSNGKPLQAGDFNLVIQDYCYTFFQFGMPGTYEAFRAISERMLKSDPKNVEYLNNLGSYWLVAQKNSKQAMKYYNKVLKLDPKNYSAAKNCVLSARRDKNAKLEKKYLPILISATDSETEKMSCEARLKALN